jgi:hypothetical protein
VPELVGQFPIIPFFQELGDTIRESIIWSVPKMNRFTAAFLAAAIVGPRSH